MSSLVKLKNELLELILQGEALELEIQINHHGKATIAKAYGVSVERLDQKKLPGFLVAYQPWYTSSVSVLKHLLPDRLLDFKGHYEVPKGRKELNFESYRIHDAVTGLIVTKGEYREVVVDKSAAIPHFQQQLAILKSAQARFESSLFDIKRMIQADLFDSEISSARGLWNSGFLRAAGAVAGVVLEKHLRVVCEERGLKISKKHPSISDYNDRLKLEGVLEMSDWRRISFLGDLRNLCDHDKQKEPTSDQIEDMLSGVERVLKNIF